MSAGSTSAAAGPSSVSIEVKQGSTPLQLDVGFMLSVDPNQLDASKLSSSSSAAARDAYLLERARNSTQHLLNSIFSLPFTKHADVGPLATLPPIQPSSRICEPREKPLPKTESKPLTKWEKFAKAKGIQHRKKDKMVWDDERKDWVPRWGFEGANKDEENQWLHVMPSNAEDGYNPSAAAKKVLKERKAANEGKRLKNLQRAAASSATPSNSATVSDRAAAREVKKAQLEGDLLRSKRSTASMGRFDRALPNESKTFKTKSLKRKFEPNEVNTSAERSVQLGLLGKMERAQKAGGDKGLVNTRKAVKYASQGRGTAALVGHSTGSQGGKGGSKKGGRKGK
ncbi:RRS1-domain-containing protein [Tilletiaria anomala UBC 951]|uniref:Ribosome biogenesis regulatory protein n=1 Tax=Tilletiaria anomala (strain ATCC 24038 / CBS 436.72 / UBC 951) TaxID=1037660 RepID=A0A066WKB2_TILAU|nr:RRS1-domain-containing protein [Tilletiaria anomala UBC 951]KDN53008.1 RRS1-domain-containing protein [Tilletiaria anomala UBC 951]